MRILRLTNSDDFTTGIPAGSHAWEIAQTTAAALLGEPVETTPKVVWPTADIPGIVERWLVTYEPDVVFLAISSYWFTYELLHTEIERRLGPLAAVVRPLRKKVTTTEVVASSAPVRMARTAASYVVTGRPTFTTDEVIERIGACIRLVLAREQMTLVVRGPNSSFAANGSHKAQDRAAGRVAAVDSAISRQCKQAHVPYLQNTELTGWTHATRKDKKYLSDNMHNGADSHRQRGEREGTAMANAWREAHPGLAPASARQA